MARPTLIVVLNVVASLAAVIAAAAAFGLAFLGDLGEELLLIKDFLVTAMMFSSVRLDLFTSTFEQLPRQTSQFSTETIKAINTFNLQQVSRHKGIAQILSGAVNF